jgi:outer membrane immunogenic protein
MFKMITASALAFAVAAPAVAADHAGPRIEARAGYDRIKLKADYDDGFDQFAGSGSEDGVSYGGEIGYDAYVSDNVVVGAYAGLDLSSTKTCGEIYGLDRGCLKAGRSITLGVRAGAPIGGNGLFFVKGGYSNGELMVSYEDFEDILEDFSDKGNRDGVHIGAGAEVGLGKTLYGKVEYVYTNYKDARYSSSDFDVGADGNRHQAVLGVGLRF